MQLAGAGVGVVDAVDRVLLGEEAVELRDVGGQILHGHRRVFDDLAGLGVARHVVDEALTGTAQLPHLVAVGAVEHGIGVAETGGPEVALEVGVRPLHAASVSVLELDDEHRARISDDERSIACLLGVVLRAGEDLVVDQFAGRERDLAATALHGDERGPQRLVDRAAVDADERPGRWQRDQVEFELDTDEQRALRAGEEPAHVELGNAARIEAGGIEEGVEGVAGVAPRNLGPGKRATDQLAVCLVAEDVAERRVDAGFEVVGARALRREGIRRERPERRLAAVSEKPAGRDEVVAGGAVGDRVRAAGVVAHHAADHGPRGGGCFGAEEQAVRREERVELIADHARLHPHPPPFDIEGHDPVHVPAEIDDDPTADHLPGERRAGAARDQADPVLRRELHEPADVGL